MSCQPWVVPTLLEWAGGTGCHYPALQHHQVSKLCFPWGNNFTNGKRVKREPMMCELTWTHVSDWPLREDLSLPLPLTGRSAWWVCTTAYCLCMPVQRLINVLQLFSHNKKITINWHIWTRNKLYTSLRWHWLDKWLLRAPNYSSLFIAEDRKKRKGVGEKINPQRTTINCFSVYWLTIFSTRRQLLTIYLGFILS